MQANHEEARQLAEMKQQKSNLSRAYLEHCGALEACDIMLEVRDKMIDARTELLRRALPMLSGAGAGVLAAEICECIGMRSNAGLGCGRRGKMVDFTKNKKGDVVAVHCCDSCARAAGLTPKTPADSGKASWFCEVCGHHGIGSLTDCEIGDWLRLRPMQPNAELCGGPSGPSERAPGYASAPKTEE